MLFNEVLIIGIKFVVYDVISDCAPTCWERFMFQSEPVSSLVYERLRHSLIRKPSQEQTTQLNMFD